MSDTDVIIISAIVGFVGYIQGVLYTRKRNREISLHIRSDIIQSAYDQGFIDGCEQESKQQEES
jgi:hypothetical protein